MYMSKIHDLRHTSTLALRQRKARLLRSFALPAGLLHASLLERYLKCGKQQCACHAQGAKHGPFFYLNRSFAKGQFQSLLLKTPDQIRQARQGVAAYAGLLEVLDEVCQINYELLRRGEPSADPDL
jgi:uncharacterized protein DUF6788